MVANFCEVWLAKEGHRGPVGVNYLEKVQLATAPALFGAILAGVDYVLVGAGIPAHIPGLATRLSRLEPVTTDLTVEGDTEPLPVPFDPRRSWPEPRWAGCAAPMCSPSSRCRPSPRTSTAPSGPGRTASWSRATARAATAPRPADRCGWTRGRPGLRTARHPDFARMAALGLPFWIAGGACGPEQVARARARARPACRSAASSRSARSRGSNRACGGS